MLLYQEIRDYLFTLIAQDNTLKKLPSERELQGHFNSTRITVREALMRLEVEGIIYRQNRKGWFICPPRLEWNPVNKVNFYQLAKEQSFDADTRLVSIDCSALVGEKSQAITSAFSLNSHAEFYQICRVRSLDDRPVMVEEIYCQAEHFHGLAEKELTGSITAIFKDDYNVNVTAERSSIHVTALPESVAKLLHLNSGASCLKIIRQRFSQHKALVDYNIEYWVHGAIEIKVDSY
ncbi:UTRA domain-containing protein [Thalassotalea hakodatensis]|uniref:UTRA domain-containing protein n=1 Tax=Thalassotalea hakodatensis TaxID=3030492 RepID=UPI002572812E|nr:UTRA domain-containing protein [Thalassotalea hakodatensis]